ncbi:MAG: fucose isomerase [Acidobacteriota bacterium]|nr:fucose isomerase [Acidobacteriota bacterium]
MMKIALLQFDSGRHDLAAFERDRREFLSPLRNEFELTAARSPGEAEADLQVIFVASGGCEQKFRQLYPGLAKPLILLADGQHNSLAAALEISSWIRQQGEHAEIVHGDSRFIVNRLKELARFGHVRRMLAGRIGIIGEPSDWLIGSAIDRAAATKRWRTEFVDIDLAELKRRQPTQAEVAKIAGEFIDQAETLDGVDKKAVEAAARLYPALKNIFKRQRLQAATLRCFSLIETLDTSGCLALSRLNDEGRICGCEGDVPAAFSMLLLFALTGETPFMANPAAIDSRSNQLILAHCTVPRRAVSRYRLQTHFETGLGVGLSGDFAAGPVTVFKTGDPDLGNYFVSGAEVIPGCPQPGLCRTQVRLRMREPVGYFLNASLANHHLLVRGDHARIIDEFMHYCGCRRVKTIESYPEDQTLQ